MIERSVKKIKVEDTFFVSSFYVFKKVFYLKPRFTERKGEGEGEREKRINSERSSVHWFTSQIAAWPGLSQFEPRNLEILLDLPRVYRGPRASAVLCCFPKP